MKVINLCVKWNKLSNFFWLCLYEVKQSGIGKSDFTLVIQLKSGGKQGCKCHFLKNYSCLYEGQYQQI